MHRRPLKSRLWGAASGGNEGGRQPGRQQPGKITPKGEVSESERTPEADLPSEFRARAKAGHVPKHETLARRAGGAEATRVSRVLPSSEPAAKKRLARSDLHLQVGVRGPTHKASVGRGELVRRGWYVFLALAGCFDEPVWRLERIKIISADSRFRYDTSYGVGPSLAIQTCASPRSNEECIVESSAR